jgi:C-methyltransferase C-terminal domain/Putative zinc binding domain/Methyltransferase domain
VTGPVACRSCGASDLELILSLGMTPLANSLIADPTEGPEPRFSLDLVFCPTCTLVQITETVPPEQLFRDYLYFSSFSDTMLVHARELVNRFVTERHLGPKSLAIEIASNDGYLLQYYKQAAVPVLGIEPARNVAKVAIEERGIPTMTEFFDLSLATRLAAEEKRADILHANNVLAHVADLNGFVAGIRAVLADQGVAALEFPYVGDMIDRCEFDTIYHEHLCYFSLSALVHLFSRHGLKAIAVDRLPIHGGSLLLQVARAEADMSPGPSVEGLLAEERSRGLLGAEFYRGFARRVTTLKGELCALLARLKAEGRSIAAYGAAAKGSTLLNTFAIGNETLDFVADRSTHKQGRYMPGVRIPIVPPVRLQEAMPDYTLLLTWNFADEILEQQAEYRRRGGRFILPIPDVKVI